MIPKTIHYCWFGGNEKPKLALRCIESWRRYCPDYEIIEWNEENFDISKNRYAREAYENKKYAFITDFVRLKVLGQYGGIYMDTDVEVLGSLDEFLHHQAFSGFESDQIISTGIMGCERGFSLFETFLAYYYDASFIKENGQFDTTPNTVTLTSIIKKYGFIPDGSYQVVQGFALYPKDVFSPLEIGTGILNLTDKSKTIHYYSASWYSKSMKFKHKLARYIKKILKPDTLYWWTDKLSIKRNT